MDTPSDPIVRKNIALPTSLWEAINDYRHANKIKTEVEAVRRLLREALGADNASQ
jgi:hypothetical protein